MSAVPNDLCCFRITVVASAIIALAWLALKKRRKKESQKIDDSSILATCRSGNLAILSSEALDNAWYGSLRPLTNLTQTFQACHLRTFNLGASFFPSLHMVYYRTPWGLPEPMFFYHILFNAHISCMAKTLSLKLTSALPTNCYVAMLWPEL